MKEEEEEDDNFEGEKEGEEQERKEGSRRRRSHHRLRQANLGSHVLVSCFESASFLKLVCATYLVQLVSKSVCNYKVTQ